MEMFRFKNENDEEKIINLDNYLLLDSKNLEENAHKVLKFDHLDGSVDSENYIFSNGIIVKNKKYALYDFFGNKLSEDYKCAYPLLNDNMFYVTNKVKENDNALKMVQTYGIVDSNGKEVFEVEDIFDSIVPVAMHTSANEVSEKEEFEKIFEDGKVGFKDSLGKIIVTPIYDSGFYKDDKFIVQKNSRIYIFDKNGNNIIINEKINKICDKLITSLKLNVGDNYSDLELFYNLHFLIDILDGCYYLYDLENDKVVKANELLPCDEKVSKKGSFVRKRK